MARPMFAMCGAKAGFDGRTAGKLVQLQLAGQRMCLVSKSSLPHPRRTVGVRCQAMQGSMELVSDPWTLLGVPAGSTAGVIKQAFRAKSKGWHPDISSHPDAEAFMVALIQAKEDALKSVTEGVYGALTEADIRRKERCTKVNTWEQQINKHKARWGGASTSAMGRRGACLETPPVTAEAAPKPTPAAEDDVPMVVYPFPNGDLFSFPSKGQKWGLHFPPGQQSSASAPPSFSGFGDMPSDCGCDDDDLPLPHSSAGNVSRTGEWARLQDIVASGGGGPDPVEFPGSGSSKYPKQGPARGVPYAIIERQLMGF
eukprot:jgi/Botrbrau1/16692/Bobra.0267s0008.1